MTCDSVSNLIALYYYGELMPEEEDRLETHLAGCAACARELERQRKLAAALDQRTAPLSPLLLEDCRADLMAAVAGGAPRIAGPRKGPWTLFLEAMASTFSGMGRMRQPLGATVLIALGFMAAKITPGNFASIRGGASTNGGASMASMTPDDVFSTVRSVEPDSAGRVQISYDETRRRVVEGRMDDQAIQRLLLAGSHQEENPAVRGEAVDILKSRAGSSVVRDALLNRLATDPIANVRLKALEGLKPLSTDPEVRKTLAQVLMTDDNAAVRMQVLDVLMAHRDDSMVGMLQGLMQREDNGYVRLRCEKALKEMNASIGTF